MFDPPGRHDLAGGIDDAADGALGSNRIPLRGVGIDTFQVMALERAALLVEYHQGMPFIAVRTAVRGSRSGANSLALAWACCAFSAQITTSCGPNVAGSSLAGNATVRVCPSTISLSPWLRMAARCAPRAIAHTSWPANASSPAM